MLEKQEIHCHECNKYVQFDIDTELDGNHVLTCPVCRHEHCRVVTNGIITDARWDRRNGTNGNWVTNTANITSYSVTQAVTYIVTRATVTVSSTYDNWYQGTQQAGAGSSTATGTFMYDSWINSGRYGT